MNIYSHLLDSKYIAVIRSMQTDQKSTHMLSGLPRWQRGKKPTCQCRFDPWVGKIPWRRKWQLTPVFLLGKSHRQRRLAGYSPWGCKESNTAERLTHTRHYAQCFEFISDLKAPNHCGVAQWYRIHLQMQEMQEMWVRSLGWEDPLEEEIHSTHSSIFASEIPWTEEIGRLQSMALQKSQRWLSD